MMVYVCREGVMVVDGYPACDVRFSVFVWAAEWWSGPRGEMVGLDERE